MTNDPWLNAAETVGTKCITYWLWMFDLKKTCLIKTCYIFGYINIRCISVGILWMFDQKKNPACNSSIPNWRWRRWCGWQLRRWPSDGAWRWGWVGFPRAHRQEPGLVTGRITQVIHGDAQEEAPLFVTDHSVRIGVGKPVPLVCGSTGKTGEWITKPPGALFGCVGAGHRNAATARGI